MPRQESPSVEPRRAPAVGSVRARTLLYTALAVLFLLHNDLWLWHDRSLLLGLPIGLTYHLLYCVATAALMALVVRYAWPLGPGQGSTDIDGP